MARQTPSVAVYIDETGDRGSGPQSSPIFGMAAVMVDCLGAPILRAAVHQLRDDFGVPSDAPMSWKRHVKTHDRRKRAVDVLARVNGIRVCYVYAAKSELEHDSYRGSPRLFYNYVALRTYTSALWAVRHWKGEHAKAWTRFGHVKGHDHRSTEFYLRSRVAADARIPDTMEQGLRWVSADRYLESQAADLYGGFLKAALWPDGAFGYVEPSYLLGVWHQIRNSDTCVVPLGIMSMPRNELVTQQSWFPCASCPQT